jgi:hypothetical protein
MQIPKTYNFFSFKEADYKISFLHILEKQFALIFHHKSNNSDNSHQNYLSPEALIGSPPPPLAVTIKPKLHCATGA